MSYKNLEIWQLAREIALEVHKMTLEDLPKFEMLRRVNKSEGRQKAAGQPLLKGMEESDIRMNISNS